MALSVLRDDGQTHPAELSQQMLFAPPTQPQAAWTIERWWSEVCQPQLVATKAKATITGYETHLRRWTAWHINHRTASPVVGNVTSATLREFRTYLLTSEKCSPVEADKHCGAISALLKLAEDDQIIPRAPRLKRIGTPAVGLRFIFEADEVTALYTSAAAAPWPTHYSDGTPCRDPGAYWQAFLVGGWNYGFRPQEFWSYEKSFSPLAWSGVCFEPRLQIEGRAVDNAAGWCCWSQEKTGHEMRLPMNPVLRRHFQRLRELRPNSPPAARVFDFPNSAGTAKGRWKVTPTSGFFACWWDIVRRAGITPLIEAGQHATHCPKHFRKTAHTNHRERIGEAADWITGHSSSAAGIGARHYFNATATVIRALHELPQPWPE